MLLTQPHHSCARGSRRGKCPGRAAGLTPLPRGRQPAEGALRLLLPREAKVDGDRDHGRNNRQSPPDPVNTRRHDNAERPGRGVADEGPDDSQHSGPQQRDVLLSSQEQPGQTADNGTDDDRPHESYDAEHIGSPSETGDMSMTPAIIAGTR